MEVAPLTPRRRLSLPPSGGSIGPDPQDFFVEEVPAYPFCGNGEHLYLWVEKERLNTADVAKRLARVSNVRERDIGFAGMKDKHAVTRQWFSLVHDGAGVSSWDLGPDCRILDTARHTNKLRTGHLLGNRFRIAIYGSRATPVQVDELVAALSEQGFPNTFGPQRFGVRGRNLVKAFAWLRSQETGDGAEPRRRRARKGRFDNKLLSSVLQAEIFNRYVETRLFGSPQLIPGEVVRLEGTGSHFVVEDAVAEQPRFASGDLRLTGPMIGPKGLQAQGAARELEREVASGLGLSSDDLSRLGKHAPGTRRDLLLHPEELRAEWEGEHKLVLHFFLPAGAYATTLVREVTDAPWDEPRQLEPRLPSGSGREDREDKV